MTRELEALARNPLNPDNAAVAARVFADAALWGDFEKALYPDASLTDGESAAIDRVLAAHCRPRVTTEAIRAFVAQRLERLSGGDGFALAAASARAGADSAAPAKPASSAEPVTFVFVSDASDDTAVEKPAWRAEMTLPPDAGVDSLLAISIAGRDGEPLDGGFFRVAGAALPVSKGRAEIPYGFFLAGLKDARVERVTPRGERQSGTLALF